jgi:hypothetical protein
MATATNQIKQFFKRQGIPVRVRTVPVKHRFYQVWIEWEKFQAGTVIPNHIRKAAVCCEYNKTPEDFKAMNILNPENINYGNTSPNRLTLDETNLEKFFKLCEELK